MNKTVILERIGILLTAGLVILAVVVVSGCAQDTQSTQESQRVQISRLNQASQYTHIVSLSASWAILYQDLKSLKQASDIVVEGTFSKVADTTKDGHGLVFTDFVFNVSRVVVNPQNVVVSTDIIIHQTGGIVGNILYQIGDDPLFQLGEQSILFLHQFSSGHFFVAGGPSGRFTVSNGMVKPINDEGVQFSSMPEADFLTSVQKA